MFNKERKSIKVLIFTLLVLLIFPSVVSAKGGKDEGKGDNASQSGLGVWHTATDEGYDPSSGQPSKAWQKFYSLQMKTKYGGDASRFKKRVEKSGYDLATPSGSLWESCKKSRYIAWYGSASNQVIKGTKYAKGTWYTQTRGSHKAKFLQPGAYAIEQQKEYEQWSKNWTKGSVILICSHTWQNQTPKKLTFVANSGRFRYDGQPKTVSGLNVGQSKLSALKKGHTYKTVATRTETKPGTYKVNFQSVKIFNEKGKDITNSGEYTIETKPGKLTIFEDIEEEDKPKPQQGDEWRCVGMDYDRAQAIVENVIFGEEAFSPRNSPGLRPLEKRKTTEAGYFSRNNRPPGKGATLSSWYRWKNQFEAYDPDAEITEELDLEASGISDVLSKYGGVYDIRKELGSDVYEAYHCQPQTRDLVEVEKSKTYCSYNEFSQRYDCYTDYWYEWEWTPWEDAGPRIIDHIVGPGRIRDDFTYQILSVNCNAGGFSEALRSVNAENISYGGQGSSLLVTKQERGIGGSLGSGLTGRDSFYTSNSSCNVFTCVADPSPGADSDAINNKNNTGYYQAEYPYGHDKAGKEFQELGKNKDSLIFFRDNEDNEVRADVWYPEGVSYTDLMAYGDQEAHTAYGKLHEGGTPEVELTTIKPLYGSKFTETGDEGIQTWYGDQNRFIMKSQWSSKQGKPHELSLAWVYNASGYNHEPAIVGGDEIVSKTGLYRYDFDVACGFENGGSGGYGALIPDTPFVNGNVSGKTALDNATGRIRALFVRSTSDTQD